MSLITLQLEGAELSHDLLSASLMERQDRRDDSFGHALGCGPSHRGTIKNEPERIAHGGNISCERVERSARSLCWGLIESPGPSLLHAREDAQFSFRHAKLPTGPTHSEQGDTGIDRFGHFAGLTASPQFGAAGAITSRRRK
jgi:hypothetical protein